jgi:DNA polymerase-3 subunit beta
LILQVKGSVAVPAKLLLEILKTFPEQPLTFTVEENSTIEISSNSGKYAWLMLQEKNFLNQ